MKDIQRRVSDRSADRSPTTHENPFLRLRHIIGRLGSYHRAAKILVHACSRVPRLFDEFQIKTQPPPKLSEYPQLTDGLTTLDGIVKRMLPKDDPKLARYQEALAFMDDKFGILQQFLEKIHDKNFKPRVHAELILLEHFYHQKMDFVDDDRFIACSKPACYCCYHYINEHPGGFVRPPSHGVRYPNWRPPEILNSIKSSNIKYQNDILNEMISKIRRDALRQIEQRRGPGKWRLDSTTGISTSLNGKSLQSQYADQKDRQESYCKVSHLCFLLWNALC